MSELDDMIASVRDEVDADDAQDWFDAVVTAYTQDATGWSAFQDALKIAAGAKSIDDDAVEAFVKYGDDDVTDPMDLVRQMIEDKTNLAGRYKKLIAPVDEDDAPDEEPEDDDAAEWDAETAAEWYEFFKTSNEWAGWTGGGEAAWDQFKEWFLYYADLQQAKPQAAKFLDKVDADGGCGAGLAVNGILTVEDAPVAPAVVEAPRGWGKATAERYKELTTDKGWTGWSGVEGDWAEFTQWFLYYAAEDSDEESAQAFVTEAESGDKRAVFAGHGITLAEPAAAAEPPVAGDGPVEVSEAELQVAVDEVLEEYPELADIPEDRRRELMEEVRRELAETS